MKKSEVLFGIFAPLYYEIVFNLMMYTEYSERYAFIQNLMLFLLPALPGIVLAVVIIRNSLKEYFKAFGICFMISTIVFFIYGALNIDLMLLKVITGYDEFGKGNGIIFIVTFVSYIVSCTAGAFISGIISLCRQIKKQRNKECVK